MCGICCILGPKNHPTVLDKNCAFSRSRLSRRGPDSQCTKQLSISDAVDVVLFGSVLHLRGELTKQPCEDDFGNILLWNGEVFGGLEMSAAANDTQTLSELLSLCESDQELLCIFAAIHGPWAFIYWQARSRRLWFGRDVLGRRSLLWHLPRNTTDVFSLCSIQLADMTMSEVPALGLYSLSCQKCASEDTAGQQWSLVLHEWTSTGQALATPHMPDCIGNQDECQADSPAEGCVHDTATNHLQTNSVIDNSIAHGTEHSVVICETAQNSLLSDCYRHGLMETLIEEVGPSCVIFRVRHEEKIISPIRHMMNRVLPSCDESLPELGESDPLTYILELMKDNDMLNTVSTQLMDVLQRAVQARVDNLPRENVVPRKSRLNKSDDPAVRLRDKVVMSQSDSACSIDTHSGVDISDRPGSSSYSDRTQARVAVLFSGGLDSAVLAALADRCIPADEPIDLVNVAFEQTPRQPENRKKGRKETIAESHDPFMVPDRISGLQALTELNTNRQWNFVQVNVTKAELLQYRQSAVSELLYPLCTVLDDSIGCAVWFAARGSGILLSEPDKPVIPYLSPAKVVLVGMGADEQLAGYTRHRARFKQDGWPGLVDELELELSRIWCRNLGRDDRIISDHGRESRLPFLDEEVVSFLNNLPVHFKADLTLPRGIGEKLILRMCAAKLGLWKTAVLPKRAIQFGSRIAKMENSREKASDVCERLRPDR